jgi:NADPH:quinone reductase-like Zn-dependent oxidoreductase
MLSRFSVPGYHYPTRPNAAVSPDQLHNYNHGGVGKRIVTEPLVLGHESAGVVLKAGPAVTNIAVGDRVAILPTMFCRKSVQSVVSVLAEMLTLRACL